MSDPPVREEAVHAFKRRVIVQSSRSNSSSSRSSVTLSRSLLTVGLGDASAVNSKQSQLSLKESGEETGKKKM